MPAAATQTRVRVTPAVHSKVFFISDALLATTLPISGLGTGSEYAGLHTLRLSYNLTNTEIKTKKCMGPKTEVNLIR